MKKCKVIHINDGTASVLENGNFRCGRIQFHGILPERSVK